MDEVFRIDAEAARGDLPHDAAQRRAVGKRRVARRILAAFARITLSADAVHGCGDRFVDLAADGAERHRLDDKSPHDALGGFDLVQGDGAAVALHGDHVAQEERRVGMVGVSGEGGEILRIARARGGLQREYRGGVPAVALAVAAVGVAADIFERLLGGLRAETAGMHGGGQPCHILRVDAADRGDAAAHVALEQLLADTERFEERRTAVAADRRDAHLGHDLQHALVHGLDIVLFGGVEVERQGAFVGQVFENGEGHVGVYAAGPVAHQ